VDILHRLRSYFLYWLEAVDEHSLHSPFFYDLYTKAIKRDNNHFQNTFIEEVRNVLLFDDRVIEVNDLGTGSAGSNHSARRRVNQIAKSSLAPQRYARLFQRLADYNRGKFIVELGTSFGITAMYFANVSGASVYTFEGAPAIASLARRNFKFGDIQNIELIVGDLAETLPRFLSPSTRVDVALIDANHRYDPTIRYFQWLLQAFHPGSYLIMDDIHRCREMELAWSEIKKHERVMASIDLFRCGIVFFDPSLNKQHVVLQLN